MRREDVLVEVRDRTLARVGTITPRFLQLEATLRHNAVGDWKITLPGDHPMVDVLATAGSGLVVTLRNGKRFSGPTTHPKRKRDLQNPDGTYTFTGRTDTQLLADARAYPDPAVADPGAQTNTNDTRTLVAETLMRHYVGANITAAGAPAGRVAGWRSRLRLETTNQSRGITVTKSPRFQNLLELLSEIGLLAQLGFHVVQRGNDLVFEVLDVADRSDTVRLDIDNGTLTSEEVEQSGPSVTRVIVAGQGEGTERVVIQRSTAESLAAEAMWGRVIEDFADARSSSDLVELEQEGDERLLEGGSPATNVKVVAADDQTMQYAVDWEEGDIVTAVVSGQETKTIVSAAALIVGAGFVGVGAAIGDVVGFDANAALTKRVDDLGERLEKIERTVEIAGEAGAISWNDLEDRPAEYPPAAHTHDDRYFTESEVNALIAANRVPAGNVDYTARSTAPTGWLICDGQAVSRSTYADLFAAIGTQFGAGDGSTTFNVPNLKGRVVAHRDAAQASFDTLGETSGALTSSHEHPLGSDGYAKIDGIDSDDWITGRRVTGKPSWEGNWRSGTGTLTVGTTTLNYTTGTELGGTTALASSSTVQPTIVLNAIIKT